MSFLKKAVLASLLVLALCAAFVVPALAQDQSSARGNLSGLVYDSSQSLVPGAEVTITGPIGSLVQNTTGQGSFLFSTLIPGIYIVRVQKAGFKVSEVGNVEVLINKTTSVSVTLEPGAVTQVVEVASANLTIDTSAASVNAELADTFYGKIPIQRNVSSLFYLAPGVVSGLNTGNQNPGISGSSGLENLYVADGVAINDPAFGGLGVWSRSYGALGVGINLSFVKEVQVKTAGFEPQYGHASGGIVQIVTKSGSTSTHGAIGGFFQPQQLTATYRNADDFNLATLHGRRVGAAAWEGDVELGGYVPLGGLKNRLFYFGTFNPTWNHDYVSPAADSGLFTIYNGRLDRKTRVYDYAGKLTFKLNDKNTFESSVFGDPSLTNTVPWATLNATDTTVNSKWDFGTRSWATRYDGTISSTWLVDAAFTWNWNHFTETPLANITQIADQTQLDFGGGSFNAQGFGFLEPYESNTKAISVDTSKSFHFAGQHTFSVGYTWAFPKYNDITEESGGKYTIPDANATGGDPGYLTNPLGVAGKMTDASLTLIPTADVAAASGCTLCPFMSVPDASSATGFTQTRVVLQQTRGRFDGGVTRSSGKYNAAYANDSWAIGTHVTLNVGLRWEQQRLTGNIAEKVFNDMWSPRVGIIVDPKGDRKSKIYANFGRYAFVLPLDAAVRELSAEDDFFNAFYAPASTTTGCPAGMSPCVITGADGTTPDYANLFVPDSAHLLNKASGGVAKGVSVLVSGITPFQPGVRMEYSDEFVVGAEHQFRGGVVASARYIDRRLKRVIEDEGGISVEQFNALIGAGGELNYFIGNPSGTSDIFVNPNEITFSPNTTYNVPVDGSGNPLPFTAANYPGVPAGCFDKNGNGTPFTAFNNATTFGQIVGSACFPAVNTSTWTTSSGAVLPQCGSLAESKTGTCAAFGGEFYADGKPDTYKDPKREYEAVEFEVNKAFSHNWAMVANWRIAQLRGNYEGAFRNDNQQADPGISSLFDLTEGAFGLLGQQQGIGFLNTDRRHVVNVYTNYVLDRSFAKGLVLGTGVKVQSGIPLTTLVAQEAYQNPGEVPIFGRGDLGRSPVTGSVDAHMEYPWKISDRFTLKFGFDMFNIANARRNLLILQNADQGFGIPEPDFKKPFQPAGVTSYFFQAPFSARANVRFEF